MRHFTIFGEDSLRGYLESCFSGCMRVLREEEREYLLNVNETEYVQHLRAKYEVEPLSLDFENLRISDREVYIPAERFPRHGFTDVQGQSYPRQVVTFHLPFSGDRQQLLYKPSRYITRSEEVWIEDNFVCFEVVDFYEEPERLKHEADSALEAIRRLWEFSNEDVAEYNKGLEARTLRAVQERKTELLRQLNLLAALNVPVRKRSDVPSTFAVPVQRKRIVVQKPTASAEPFAPEPSLDRSAYSSILQMLHDVGVEMEIHPAIYTNKTEEALRDYFLMVLAPNFQSTTGETFNRTGKTDILIKHEGKNLFIAECKFWSGVGGFYRTVDQLLGYLTWRDSKAAVLLFVKNKELQPVLDQIAAKTKEHGCFVKDWGRKADGWYEYEFHLKEDASRSAHLAVLCFHFPD